MSVGTDCIEKYYWIGKLIPGQWKFTYFLYKRISAKPAAGSLTGKNMHMRKYFLSWFFPWWFYTSDNSNQFPETCHFRNNE